MRALIFLKHHELLIAKLDAYGFYKNPFKLINSYLSNGKQRVKIKGKYSSWSEIILEVPQGSILGPLLFNSFICDMFCFKTLISPIVMTTLLNKMRIKIVNLSLII